MSVILLFSQTFSASNSHRLLPERLVLARQQFRLSIGRGDLYASRRSGLAGECAPDDPSFNEQPGAPDKILHLAQYPAGMPDRTAVARVEDVHRLALAMPHVTVTAGTKNNPVYQVGGKSFVFFRNPRPDAFDPDSGERYHDVIVFWVADEAEKQALVQDESTPFFSTPHFDGHPSVLVRGSRLGELSLAVLQEIVQDAWLARASRRRAEQWLSSHPVGGMPSAG
jgi:hypothetical protein